MANPIEQLGYQNIAERMERNENVTNEDLHALRRQVKTLPQAERERITASINTFEQQNTDRLTSDVGTRDALTELRQTMLETTPQSEMERMGREIGGIAGATTEKTLNNAKALAYNQWAELMHPDTSPSVKVLKVLGLLWMGYSIYRTARWVMGKRKDSAIGKIFKFLGVTALAGFAINTFGDQLQKKQAAEQKKTTDTPAQPAEAGIAYNDPILETKGNLLSHKTLLNVNGTSASLERISGSPVLSVGDATYDIWKGMFPVGPLLSEISFKKGEYHIVTPAGEGLVAAEELKTIIERLKASSNTSTTIPVSFMTTTGDKKNVELTFSKRASK